MPKPAVSVMILAHDRKRYLKRAIASVVNQTLSRRLYEIVVVKNFRDSELDGYIRGVGARSIVTGDNTLGCDYALGVEACRGEVIAFMEDDDIFYRRKLAKVYNTFKNPDICYYHNACFYINDDGERIGEPHKKLGSPVIVSAASGDLLSKLFVGNMSSVAMRSGLVKEHTDALRSLYIVDGYLIFLSLASRKQLYFDSDRSTGYAIHVGSSANPSFSSYGELRDKQLSFTKRILDTYKKMDGLISEPKPERYRYVRWELSYHKALFNILNGRAVYRLGLGDYLNMLMDWSMPVLLASIILKISPSMAGNIYYNSIRAAQRHF